MRCSLLNNTNFQLMLKRLCKKYTFDIDSYINLKKMRLDICIQHSNIELFNLYFIFEFVVRMHYKWRMFNE